MHTKTRVWKAYSEYTIRALHYIFRKGNVWSQSNEYSLVWHPIILTTLYMATRVQNSAARPHANLLWLALALLLHTVYTQWAHFHLV